MKLTRLNPFSPKALNRLNTSLVSTLVTPLITTMVISLTVVLSACATTASKEAAFIDSDTAIVASKSSKNTNASPKDAGQDISKELAKLIDISNKSLAEIKLMPLNASNGKVRAIKTAETTTFEGITDIQPSLGTFAAERSLVVETAKQWLGIPYRYGGTSNETGADCSGFTWAVMRSIGINMPRTAYEQAVRAVKVAREELLPGDLVFYNTLGRLYSHVGIYLGNNKFIHSPRAGRTISIENMDIPYWNSRFNGARRVIE